MQAVEIPRIGSLYNGSALLPVVSASDLRQEIADGWEICTHPFLNTAATEAVMVSDAQTENQLLRDLLSGAKRAVNSGQNYGSTTYTTHTPDRPDLASYPITTAVYQGGARNATSDQAIASCSTKSGPSTAR